jgi:hypothetical protein
VFITACSLPGLDGAARWSAESRAILEEEIFTQTYSDGGSREQAFGYHVFALQFAALAAIVAQRSGAPFSPAYHERLGLMFDFTAAMCEGGPPVLFGDYDDGYVADFGGDSRNPREWMALGERFLSRERREWTDPAYGETAWWLAGDDLQAGAETIAPRLRSRAFPASGRYFLQDGRRDRGDAVSVEFDCAEFGFGAIAAHGHADSLAFTLRAFGLEVLVDPGTYDYFSYPEWRDYFRSTRAHNTIEIDGREQSDAVGPFMWGARANCRCTAWQPREGGGSVEGVHDGYERLPDPVSHRRRLDLDGAPARALTVTDTLVMKGRHDVAAYYHFSEESCTVSPVDGAIEAATPRGTVRLVPDARLTASMQHGATDPIAGWVSRGYHRKTATTTVRLTGSFAGNVTLITRIHIA